MKKKLSLSLSFEEENRKNILPPFIFKATTTHYTLTSYRAPSSLNVRLSLIVQGSIASYSEQLSFYTPILPYDLEYNEETEEKEEN